MGCVESQNKLLDMPLSAQTPPVHAVCPALVVPPQRHRSWDLQVWRKPFSLNGNDYQIKNLSECDIVLVQGQGFLFDLDITGLNGVPILRLGRECDFLTSAHYLLQDPQSARVLYTVYPRSSAAPTLDLFIGKKKGEGNALPLLTVKGDIWEHRWSVLNNRGECISKARSPNINNKFYSVHVAEGVDSLLVMALILIIDDFLQRRKMHRARRSW